MTGTVNRKNRSSPRNPDLESGRRSVAHCVEIPVPVYGELPTLVKKIYLVLKNMKKKGWFLTMMLNI